MKTTKINIIKAPDPAVNHGQFGADTTTELKNVFVYSPGYLNRVEIDEKAIFKGYGRLEPDPSSKSRWRSYTKLNYNLVTGDIIIAQDQAYFQKKSDNSQDGGKGRFFEPIDDSLLDALKCIVMTNIEEMMERFYIDIDSDWLTIGVHCIRYKAAAGQPSYATPYGFHKDTEPGVFLNVLHESQNLEGGDSLITRYLKQCERVIHLKPYSGLLLTRDYFHDVTPMEPQPGTGTAYRDILLTTIEDDDYEAIRPH